ncbi:MFS transporter [Intrasporangium sp.]|uniref:MFS transporter n=1 Tax=Intrasporangium sp. TaxID=1925024 RepID=UPI003221ADC1
MSPNASRAPGPADAGSTRTLPYAEDILPTEKASLPVVVWMAVAQFGIFLGLLAPVTVSLALKVQDLVPAAEAPGALGMVLSVAAVMALVANPVVGRLSDRTTSRWGRRRPWMIAGCAVFILGMVVIATAGSVAMVLVGWLLGQLGDNMILAPLLTTIADQVPEFQRGTVSANVGIMQNVGILAAAYVASWFVHNMFLLFVVPAVIATITVVVYCIVLPDRQVRVHAEPGGWMKLLRTFWVNPLEFPDFGWAWVSRFCMILSSFLFITFRLFFLQHRVELTTDEAVQAITAGVLIYTIALVIAAKIGGWLSDRYRRRKVFVIATAALFGVGTYLLAHVTSLSGYYLVEVLMGATYGIYYAVDMALVVDVLPNPDDAAKDLGVMNIANALPQSLAGALGGWLLGLGSTEGTNYTLLFLVAGIVAVLGAAAILPIKKVR